ncbi:MAG: zinc ribbon domain-containing protein [Candidatus Atribacteria bacterium]|nr:zinc ribbon domain-containing protein [Spirochaetota bacterium]MBE3119282.1 zinc ribbon domain-containing protein [Candidatus Atribacteria bacterium]
MAMKGFTDNFSDTSTEAGFQFTFFCNKCKEGYKTDFVASKTYKKKKFFSDLGKIAGAAAQLAGKYNIGYGVERGTDALAGRFQGMSSEWQKEHETVFETAQNEAKGHFHRCPKCKEWVCDNDWNEQEGLCVDDAPRENVEVAAAKAKKKMQDIQDAAAATQVFTGKIESKQTLCPACGKPAGEGKFCSNCGANLEMAKCPKCGAKNAAGTKFCGECGQKLGT